MKTQKKKNATTESIPCFECEDGMLHESIEDYVTHHPQLGDVTVPDVPLLRCHQCDEFVLGEEANRRVDAFLDRAVNAISPEEVRAFLSKYHLTQKQASQITGLGEKNISRWLTGRSRPSESVSNFLRLLLSDEMAFERLRQKNFGDEPYAAFPEEERQPNDEEKEVLKFVDYSKLAELEFVPETRSPAEKRTGICRWAHCVDLIEFREKMEAHQECMAAFKDTWQKSNPVSGGIWVWIGEQAAAKVTTSPYDRVKLRKAVRELRELTQHPLEDVIDDARSILAKAGVALVFVPTMKQSALRGCTRLLTANKALIIHSLKYRSLAQFWVVLFHEIGHLLLHVSKPGELIPEYDEKSADPREAEADSWAYDTLVSVNRELEWKSTLTKPEPWQVKQFAKAMKVHPAIVVEIFNAREGKQTIPFSRMNQEGLFPYLSEDAVSALMATSRMG